MAMKWLAIGSTSLLLSCGAEPGPDRFRVAAYPLESIRIGPDGTQAWVRLANSVPVAGVIDLKIFGDLRPEERPQSACPFGEPLEVSRWESESLCVYNRSGIRVAVVTSEEVPSWGGKPIPRYELRALPEDPPFAQTLPKPLKDLLEAEEGLRTVALIPGNAKGLGLVLRLDSGRVRGVAAVPLPQLGASRVE